MTFLKSLKMETSCKCLRFFQNPVPTILTFSAILKSHKFITNVSEKLTEVQPMLNCLK